jgi:hypothetical protein
VQAGHHGQVSCLFVMQEPEASGQLAKTNRNGDSLPVKTATSTANRSGFTSSPTPPADLPLGLIPMALERSIPAQITSA